MLVLTDIVSTELSPGTANLAIRAEGRAKSAPTARPVSSMPGSGLRRWRY